MRQRATVTLAMVTVLPESLRAFWAAASSTPLLHRAAAADAVVVEDDEAVAGAEVVVVGYADPVAVYRPHGVAKAAVGSA